MGKTGGTTGRAGRALALGALLGVAVAPVGRATPAGPASALPLTTMAASTSTGPGAAELQAAHGRVDALLRARQLRRKAWEDATRARDAAAAQVTEAKRQRMRGASLEAALRRTLALDEETARARSALLAADAAVAAQGAELLRLYDNVLVGQRRAVETLPPGNAARSRAVTTYRALAAQRDAVRAALAPVLHDRAPAHGAALPAGVDLEARPDDDVEALLEKADLARDLEQRFLRQAEQVRQRIRELEEERALVDDVSGMMGRSQLFDEEDRRMVLFRTEAVRSPVPASSRSDADASATETARNSGADSAPAGGAVEADDAASPPSAPEAAAGDAAPSAPVSAPTTEAPPAAPPPAPELTVVRGEQVISAQTGALGVGVATSMDELRALEARLKAQARALRDKSKRLTEELTQREP